MEKNREKSTQTETSICVPFKLKRMMRMLQTIERPENDLFAQITFHYFVTVLACLLVIKISFFG